MTFPSLTLWRFQEFVKRILGWAIFLSFAVAFGRFGSHYLLIGVCVVCAYFILEAIADSLRGWHYGWEGARYCLIFLVVMALVWFYKDHTVTLTITPPLW